jgi:hypothetical protein
MNDTWSQTEVELIIADYFSMLQEELKGSSFNKAEHARNLLPLLNSRSKGSIEFKHQNISAILIKLGLPYIKGYKPLFNYQGLLEEKIKEYLNLNSNIESSFESFSNEIALIDQPAIQFSNWVVDKPMDKIFYEPIPEYKKPIKINYIEKEQRNRELGLQGEKIVVEYEKWYLIQHGKEALADKIEWLSNTEGDGHGFDILSKNLNGTDKYIEVKTTKLSKDAPIFFSGNEFEFSKKNAANFHLYRLFDFNKDPKMFSVNGSYEQFCNITPIQFRGTF